MINLDEFRFALGKYVTGITIVTCNSENGPIGITANSFSSLSLSPPLVLWAPAKASKRHNTFLEAQNLLFILLAKIKLSSVKAFQRA